MIDDVTIGWGIAGRIYKGSRAVFERTKVNGEVWLPSRATFAGSGRALIFRKFAVDSVTTFSDYKKFTVSTEEKASGGVKRRQTPNAERSTLNAEAAQRARPEAPTFGV